MLYGDLLYNIKDLNVDKYEQIHDAIREKDYEQIKTLIGLS